MTITLKELADKYNFNVEDVTSIQYEINKLAIAPVYQTPVSKFSPDFKLNPDNDDLRPLKITLINGDWIDIYPKIHYSKYNTNNPSIRKALTKKLHDMREEGVRRRDRELKSMKREIKT